ncbi:MAG: UDP-N-acetylmuramoyl-tripeptide--D-alanyl-D-alanine ligase [Armatimonadetes bacterium]|nr:UDP-N-acetylmuramoyl-tripeptide--D-alanyl-D-alanine ligase [Armatimonadota bacterium]
MKPFSLNEIAAATQGRFMNADAPEQAQTLAGITTDSRKIRPGDLFIALKGPNSDGHDYVESALAGGALGALVEESWVNTHPTTSGPLLLVPDTQIALGQVAGWHASRLPARRVGVTGSSGKTTTKEMIAAALAPSGPTLKNEGSQNGETGVPLALLNLTEAHQYAVLEMGMRGPGQIRYLAEIVRPEVGVITNIGRAHLEFLGSQENVARAKGELLECLPPDGTAILPSADSYLPVLGELCRCNVITYGLTVNANLRAHDLVPTGRGSMFRVSFPDGRATTAEIPLLGKHNVLNALAAFAVAFTLGADLDAAREALSAFQPPAMRSAVVESDYGFRVLHDAYNANPDSMRAALEVLSGYPPRRIAVLGDMLELGPSEAQEHRALGEAVATSADVLIAVGPRTKETVNGACEKGLSGGEAYWYADAPAAAAEIRALVREGDTVLLKGSRGVKMEAIAEALLQPPSGLPE